MWLDKAEITLEIIKKFIFLCLNLEFKLFVYNINLMQLKGQTIPQHIYNMIKPVKQSTYIVHNQQGKLVILKKIKFNTYQEMLESYGFYRRYKECAHNPYLQNIVDCYYTKINNMFVLNLLLPIIINVNDIKQINLDISNQMIGIIEYFNTQGIYFDNITANNFSITNSGSVRFLLVGITPDQQTFVKDFKIKFEQNKNTIQQQYQKIIIQKKKPCVIDIIGNLQNFSKLQSIILNLCTKGQYNHQMDFNQIDKQKTKQFYSEIEQIVKLSKFQCFFSQIQTTTQYMLKLQQLNCSNSFITQSYAEIFQKFQNLKKLDVSGNNIGDQFVGRLKFLSCLTSLNLAFTDITKQSLNQINARCQLLKELDISYTSIQKDALLQFLKQQAKYKLDSISFWSGSSGNYPLKYIDHVLNERNYWKRYLSNQIILNDLSDVLIREQKMKSVTINLSTIRLEQKNMNSFISNYIKREATQIQIAGNLSEKIIQNLAIKFQLLQIVFLQNVGGSINLPKFSSKTLKSVTLINCFLDNNHFQTLISNNKLLTHLNLSLSNSKQFMNQKYILTLDQAQLIANIPGLIYLNLANRRMGNIGAMKIFQQLKNLIYLNLQNNSLKQFINEKKQTNTQLICNIRKLKCLNLDSNDIQISVLFSLFKYLPRLVYINCSKLSYKIKLQTKNLEFMCLNLRYLIFNQNQYSNSEQFIYNNISDWKSLVWLSLNNNNFDGLNFKSLYKNLKNLHHLDIGGNLFIQQDHINQIFQKFPKLVSLNLEKNFLTGKMFSLILKKSSNLIYLNLNNIRDNPANKNQIKKKIKSSMQIKTNQMKSVVQYMNIIPQKIDQEKDKQYIQLHQQFQSIQKNIDNQTEAKNSQESNILKRKRYQFQQKLLSINDKREKNKKKQSEAKEFHRQIIKNLSQYITNISQKNKMRFLYLKQNYIGFNQQLLRYILDTYKNLLVLDLSNNVLKQKSLSLINQSKNNFIELNLSNNPIGNFIEILQLLRRPGLLKLNLSQTNLQPYIFHQYENKTLEPFLLTIHENQDKFLNAAQQLKTRIPKAIIDYKLTQVQAQIQSQTQINKKNDNV